MDQSASLDEFTECFPASHMHVLYVDIAAHIDASNTTNPTDGPLKTTHCHRNLVSNIHSRGVNSAKAAKRILNSAAQNDERES